MKKSDINKLTYVKRRNDCPVYVEWCAAPIEIFKHEQDAVEYIKGFKREIIKEQTDAYLKGLEYRKFIDQDVITGWEFKRYNILEGLRGVI